MRDTGIQVEGHSTDRDLLARLEALSLEFLDDAHRPEPLLDVGKGLGIVEVVARDQSLDGWTRDLERPRPAARHPVTPPSGGMEDRVLRRLLVRRLARTGRDRRKPGG